LSATPVAKLIERTLTEGWDQERREKDRGEKNSFEER